MTAAPRILITGASGFIGRHLVAYLAHRGFNVRAASRRRLANVRSGVDCVVLPPESAHLSAYAQHAQSLVAGCDCVVHLAARAHVPASQELSAEALATYRAANTEPTRHLARAARDAGVRRFVLMSSVRAQIGPSAKCVLSEADEPQPTDAYGVSKLEAERAIDDIFAGASQRWVAVRPVAVYGAGVTGNMQRLLKLARLPIPLPFGAIEARRSLLSIGNLCSVVSHVLEPATPAGAVYLAADGTPLTLAEIVRALRQGLGRRGGVVAISEPRLRGFLDLIGRGGDAARMMGPLEVDISRLRAAGWLPVQDSQSALADYARAEPLV